MCGNIKGIFRCQIVQCLYRMGQVVNIVVNIFFFFKFRYMFLWMWTIFLFFYQILTLPYLGSEWQWVICDVIIVYHLQQLYFLLQCCCWFVHKNMTQIQILVNLSPFLECHQVCNLFVRILFSSMDKWFGTLRKQKIQKNTVSIQLLSIQVPRDLMLLK